MNWSQLLNDKRLRTGSKLSNYDGRSAFESDYSRLVFSSAVRRLQDKAQVFPLEKSDFVRTRLTHSLEVSALGRSLGASIEKMLLDSKSGYKEDMRGVIGSILATAGLAHDLGNPPFGHYGESAIQCFFRDWFKANPCKAAELNEAQRADFLYFNGNAQTLRLLTKLHYLIDDKGFNLTCATLAATIKYPRSSIEGNKKDRKISYKDFGYFQSEKDTFHKIANETGMGSLRHPLAFLLEAADDIAYSAADIEDGLKKNVVTYDTIKGILYENLDTKHSLKDKELFDSLDYYRSQTNDKYPDKDEIAVQRFRIKAQGYMLESVVKTFIERQQDILQGNFDEDIISASEASRCREAFKTIAIKIFKDQEILTRELVGEKVIKGLLEIFVSAVVDDGRYNTRNQAGKIYSLISDNYCFISEQFPSMVVNRKGKDEPSLYDRLLLVTDFVCGMTDTYSWNLYQRLTGVVL